MTLDALDALDAWESTWFWLSSKAWAVVMTEANASNVSVQSIKAGTLAVGGALCVREQQAGPWPGEIHPMGLKWDV